MHIAKEAIDVVEKAIFGIINGLSTRLLTICVYEITLSLMENPIVVLQEIISKQNASTLDMIKMNVTFSWIPN